MHAVGRVRRNARILTDARKDLIERDVRIRICKRDRADLTEHGIEIAAESFFIGHGKQERLGDDQLCAARLDPPQNVLICRAERLRVEPLAGGIPPHDVVDPRQENDDVRLFGEDVRIQARRYIRDAVARNAAVENVKMRLFIEVAQFIVKEPDVFVPEAGRIVPVSPALRDRISETDYFIFFAPPKYFR